MFMEFFNKLIPGYIYKKTSIIGMVIFTALFALVFINIYKPFSSADWYAVSEFMYFVYSSLLILTGVLIVVLSRIIMYYYGKKHVIQYWTFGVWIVAEIIVMSIVYTILSLAIEPEQSTLEVLKISTKNTALVLLIPYAMSLLYLSMQEKSKQLKHIKEVQDEQGGPNILSFYDEKGELRLSIKKESLFYIESADNYVCIWYLNKGSVAKFLLRNTLKAMEDAFDESNILRCHRSFMVNFDQVNIIRKGKDGIYIEFGRENVADIPVSKTYCEKVTKYFVNYS